MLGQQLATLLALSLSKIHLASAYLSVYPPVPGLPPSPYYGLRVRVVSVVFLYGLVCEIVQSTKNDILKTIEEAMIRLETKIGETCSPC